MLKVVQKLLLLLGLLDSWVNAGNLGFVNDWVPGSSMCTNNCNGHGICESTGTGPKCKCDMGWGSEFDITGYRSPSCAKKTCPAGPAWAMSAIRRNNNDVTTAHELRECSNIGLCDYDTGICKCPKGWAGNACQRKTCPNDCSGHGQCLSMKRLAVHPSALPLSNERGYKNETFGEFLSYRTSLGIRNTTYVNDAWEAEMLYGCLCDSSWTVGLNSGERQSPEWFGPDCSKKRCPSADDPLTTKDETNCTYVAISGTGAKGKNGNLCHVDCANRGVCDYNTGTCACFKGFYGLDCTLQSALSDGTSGFVPMDRVNDDRNLGRRSRNRRDKIGKGQDDMGEYFNDDL
jgi:hypothetical protein